MRDVDVIMDYQNGWPPARDERGGDDNVGVGYPGGYGGSLLLNVVLSENIIVELNESSVIQHAVRSTAPPAQQVDQVRKIHGMKPRSSPSRIRRRQSRPLRCPRLRT